MRRCTPTRIGDIWSGFRRDNPRVAYKLAVGRIPEVWGKVVGPEIAALTTRIELKGVILNISISSSVVRHEIFLRRASLTGRLNEELGAEIIRDIFVH